MFVRALRKFSKTAYCNCINERKIEIKLVPQRLHNHLFEKTDNCYENASCSSENFLNDLIVQRIELPKLKVRGNLMKHFETLGNEQFYKYQKLLEIALNISNVPKFPKKWSFKPGWSEYDPLTEFVSAIDYPDDNLLFFDVEVCLQDGQLPTIAIALSPTKWYSWCSNRIVNLTKYPSLPRLEHLIPLESSNSTNCEKIVIGHNVAYDRSRVREQYFQQKTKTKFWDTMSMGIAIFGMADHQRVMFERSDFARNSKELWLEEWRLKTCKNSLEAIHAKFCSEFSKLVIKKEYQDVFVKENIHTIRENFQVLSNYCATDVLATLEIFQTLYPQFKKRFPNSITYCGMLEMASSYLPITSNWRLFYDKCENDTSEKKDIASKKVVECAQSLVKELGENEKYKSDPWLWVSDWRVPRKSNYPKWFQNFFKLKRAIEDNDFVSEDLRLLNRDVPRVFGLCYGPYPLFFKHDFGWGFLVPNQDTLKLGNWLKCQIVKLKRDEDVVLPNNVILNFIEQNQSNGINEIIFRSKPCSKVGIFDFYRLPHPSGSSENVGSPFSKDYFEHFEQKQLWSSRFSDVLMKFLESRTETRFWGNYRKRYKEQLAVWLDDEKNVGAIAPSIIPAGTITRRAVHKLWLVSTNAKDGMIGSDLKSMVECSDGYTLVGADVDSQEQWLAALFGDSASTEKKAGATLFSQMLLEGNKSNGTDLHSMVAKEAKITRDHAKVLNYARLYGAGKAHAVEFLKQKGVSEKMAIKISEKLFTTTKGVVVNCYELKPEFYDEYENFLKNDCRPEYVKRQSIFVNKRHFLPAYQKLSGELSRIFEKWMLKKIRSEAKFAELSKKITTSDDLFKVLYLNFPQNIPLYKDGFESYTFNFLELKSREPELRTPILDCQLSTALEPLSNSNSPAAISFSQKYKRSIINWFVQSSAVDFLHMLLVCMNWLCEEYEIEARFVISIHDEIRYMVKEKDKYRCALALLLSNMYTRSAISSKLGINQLPMSIAFFSKVDIDKILRKEIEKMCYYQFGNLVSPGESLNIKNVIEKTNGTLKKKSCIEDKNNLNDVKQNYNIDNIELRF